MSADASGIKAGRAYVEIGADDSAFSRAVDRVQAKMKAVGATLGRLGSGLSVGGLGGTAAIAGVVKAALDVQGVMRRFKSVYAEAAGDAQAWAKDTADAAGRTETSVLAALTTFGALFKGLGFNTSQAANLGKEVTALAQDFSSFYGISDDEALDRLRSALTGSSEVMDQFGVNIKAAAIDQELLAQGIEKTTANASDQQKMLAIIGIVTKSLRSQGALGDAFKNAGSAGNQIGALQGKLTDLAATIGEAVLPAVQSIVGTVGGVIGSLSSFAKENAALVGSVGSLAVALTALSVTGGGTLLLIGKLAASFNPVTLAIGVTVGVLAGAIVAMDAFTSASVKAGDAAGRALARNDAQRSADEQAARRLETIANKWEKTNAEIREAGEIVAMLNGRYDELGLTFDKATGKVGGLYNALQALREQQTSAAVADLEIAAREKRGNITTLQQQRAVNDSNPYAQAADALYLKNQKVESDAIGRQIKAQYDQLVQIEARIKALKGGDAGERARTGAGVVGAADAEVAKRQADATATLQDAAKAATRANRSAAENTIDDLTAELLAAQKVFRDLVDEAAAVGRNVPSNATNAIDALARETYARIANIQREIAAGRLADMTAAANAQAEMERRAAEEAAAKLQAAVRAIDFATIESFGTGQNRASRQVASLGNVASNAAEKTATNTATIVKKFDTLIGKLAVGNG